MGAKLMPNYLQLSNKIKAWTKYVTFDEGAQQQVNRIAELPFIYHHVAIMPDVHLGKGATVGSVIPTKNAVIPATVGVDIGCGMMAIRTQLFANQLPDDLAELRHKIESCIPVGFGKWHADKIPDLVVEQWNRYLSSDYQQIIARHPLLGLNKKTNTRIINDINHLGTLGGGNHFVEICLDEQQQVWLMLHSGSRGVGNCIGSYFIELAKKDMGNLLGQLPDKELAYFSQGTKHFDDYFFAVNWAQRYAKINRDIMMHHLISAVSQYLNLVVTPDLYVVNCHHNYVAKEFHFGEEVFVTRKGAVSARKGELGIIPGSMGAKSFIVQGLGNSESFCSCSHGAGRIMSREKAKKLISLQDHLKAIEDVECRKDKDIIDESPAAYKNIDDVMKSQSDLVEILFTLKQIICVKG